MARPNAARMRRIKRALAARDGAGCFYCGHRFPVLALATVDHLIPQSVMPGWHQANLVLACPSCNEVKADQLPQVFLRATGRSPGARPVRPVADLAAVVGSLVRTVLARVGSPGFAHRPAVGGTAVGRIGI